MGDPWENLSTDLPQPGTVEDLDHGVPDLFGTDPDNPTVFDDDEPDELNVYDEADDEFEEDEA